MWYLGLQRYPNKALIRHIISTCEQCDKTNTYCEKCCIFGFFAYYVFAYGGQTVMESDFSPKK